ncbi:sensor histidine kinase [Pseudoduganella violacea]|uniref:histidine kinase n=1 Tax=Pseudoduganella violacea TaxID=1715466 RepID=A0A7W5B8S5_9BURK|nr:HAMP domain-containing sensor histidine kinase [Pseudoduganella violacea]MBB3118636.1 signal transduction histidine kinase [Pseudoduganella violacea]
MTMHLPQFITTNLEAILVEWEAFARSQAPSGSEMTTQDLRDHAAQILSVIAADIATRQTAEEQHEKSLGHRDPAPTSNSPAAIHGRTRQGRGFSLPQVVAEFRALRASVTRLWLASGHKRGAIVDELIRFDEALDQAQAESILKFSEEAALARDTFLAILGHDLRNPLAAITSAGHVLAQRDAEASDHVGSRILRSARTMNAIVRDLLELARLHLGGDIPLHRKLVNLEEICRAAMEEANAAFPEATYQLDVRGDVLGYFDGDRIQQLFANLCSNAAQYSTDGKHIALALQGEPTEIVFQIRNFGPVIPAASLPTLMDRLTQVGGDAMDAGRPANSLGLGLYIVREITLAHGCMVTVESAASSGTLFQVRLPRAAAA